MADLFLPIKLALAEYMGRFKQSIVNTHQDTPAMQDYVANRPLKASMVFVPSRMVDAIEEIMSAWRKNSNAAQAQSTAFLPVISIAIARDYTPASPSQGMMLGDPIDVKIPNYPDQRNLKLELLRGQLRVQIVVIAPEDSTAKSLMARFCHFVRRYDNRGFDAIYRLAGIDENWFNSWDTQDIYPMPVTIAQTNLAIQKVDLLLNIAIPMIYGAGATVNSGIGTGTPDDPFGYPVLTQINMGQINMPDKVLL